MARPKGSQKTGGRKKGTPNKKTTILNEHFESLGLDVPERINLLLPELPIEKQVEVLLKLMEFLYPKRKPLEVNHNFNHKSFSELVSSIIDD